MNPRDQPQRANPQAGDERRRQATTARIEPHPPPQAEHLDQHQRQHDRRRERDQLDLARRLGRSQREPDLEDQQGDDHLRGGAEHGGDGGTIPRELA